MSELKALIRNRVKCCEKSGANGESKLWQSALDRIKELEQELALMIISKNHTATLLNSCEIALEREQFPPK